MVFFLHVCVCAFTHKIIYTNMKERDISVCFDQNRSITKDINAFLAFFSSHFFTPPWLLKWEFCLTLIS